VRPNQRGRRGGRSSGSTLIRDVLVVGTIWGGSVVTQRLAVAEIDPLALIVLRVGAAVVCFLPFAPRIARALGHRPRLLLDLGVIGSINPALCGILSGWALQYASSGVVSVLIALSPLLTAVMAGLVLREAPLRRAQVAGLGLALVGTALLVLSRSSGLVGAADGDLRGHLGALAIAFLTACSTVYARMRLTGVDPLASAAGQMTAGLLVSSALLVTTGQSIEIVAISPAVWAAVLYSGAIGLSVSFILFLGMIGRHGPTASLLSMNVMPVMAALLGALLLGELLTAPMVAGASLVLLGVFLFTRG
jgi:drug/metabolite transporter (DMT)-like permease